MSCLPPTPPVVLIVVMHVKFFAPAQCPRLANAHVQRLLLTVGITSQITPQVATWAPVPL